MWSIVLVCVFLVVVVGIFAVDIIDLKERVALLEEKIINVLEKNEENKQ